MKKFLFLGPYSVTVTNTHIGMAMHCLPRPARAVVVIERSCSSKYRGLGTKAIGQSEEVSQIMATKPFIQLADQKARSHPCIFSIPDLTSTPPGTSSRTH